VIEAIDFYAIADRVQINLDDWIFLQLYRQKLNIGIYTKDW